MFFLLLHLKESCPARYSVLNYSSITRAFLFFPLHPLFYCLLCFIAGIVSYTYNSTVLIPALISTCIIIYATANTISFKKYIFILSIACCLLYAGFFRSHQQHNNFYEYYKNYENRAVKIIGTVEHVEPVTLGNHSYSCITTLQKIGSAPFIDLRNIQPYRLKIYLPKNSERPDVGDTVSCLLTNKMHRPHDFEKYLIKEKIAASFFLSETHTLHTLERSSFSLRRFFSQWRERIFTTLRSKITQETFALFALIFLSSNSIEKKDLEDIRENFQTWGISHHLARSGLHLVLIIGALMSVMRLMPLPLVLKNLLLSILISMYTLLSWTTVSFERALLMAFISTLCVFCNVAFNPFHALILTTFIILFDNPCHLFFLDFQLSFLLTAALLWHSEFEKYKKVAQQFNS